MVELKNKRACVVGSRVITDQDVERIAVIGNLLAQLEVNGASGNALGSDIEWDKHIYVQHFLPWNGHSSAKGYPKRHNGENDFQYLALEFCPLDLREKAEQLAKDHHPAWERLQRGGRSMHTRNTFQAMGVLLEPSTYADLTIYTAVESAARRVKGGTSTAVEISRSFGIPTFNLRFDSDYYRLKAILEEKLENRVDNL